MSITLSDWLTSHDQEVIDMRMHSDENKGPNYSYMINGTLEGIDSKVLLKA